MGYRVIDDFVLSQEVSGIELVWLAASPQPTESAINAAALDAYRARKIAAINAECRARLLARYGPAEEQVSRSIGIYGASEKTAMEAGIAATIDASNTASNSVLAAADEAAVEAVSVSWPALP
jgi:hypothetical protein